MTRPILIDPADGPCDLCAAWQQLPGQPRRCNHCGEPIGVYENMHGYGFSSAKPHHWHLLPVAGVNGREAMYEELCLDCYQGVFAEAYPLADIPQAPMELIVPQGNANGATLFSESRLAQLRRELDEAERHQREHQVQLQAPDGAEPADDPELLTSRGGAG